MPSATLPPLIAHVLYRLDVGGLENGVVNLINHMDPGAFRHAVICLTEFTSFRERIRKPGVEVLALHKPPGNSIATLARAHALLRRLRPDIVHTRNLAALEYQVPATLAGVPVRLHSEHGRDANDPDGLNWKHLTVRRAARPFVHHYIALSRDLERYLRDRVHVRQDRLSQIYNGVDTNRFSPPTGHRPAPWPAGFATDESIVIGTVGRMDPVKDPLNLVQAFVIAARSMPELRPRMRLVMAGDGVLREEALRILDEARLREQAWLPGTLNEIPDLLRSLDVFVLPSLSEGISNTILEAMATSLPVIATNVGGNPELVTPGATGCLVPRADSEALALAIIDYVRHPDLRQAHGRNGLRAVTTSFSIDSMVSSYTGLYSRLLGSRAPAALATMRTMAGADSSAAPGVQPERSTPGS